MEVLKCVRSGIIPERITGKNHCIVGFFNNKQECDSMNWKVGDSSFRMPDGEYWVSCVDSELTKAFIYVSPTGSDNVYYYIKNGRFVFGDDVSKILGVLLGYGSILLDEQAIREYLALTFCLQGKTVIRDLNRVLPGEMVQIDLESDTCESKKLFHANFCASCKENSKEMAIHFDELMAAAMDSIFKRIDRSDRVCLALSNGLDSRMVGHYAAKRGRVDFAYFFGERFSPESAAANEVASTLGIPLLTSDGYENFFQYIDESARRHPLADAEWAKYEIIKRNIPKFDLSLSGRMGNHLFGGWEYTWRNEYASDEEIAKELLGAMLRKDVNYQGKQELLNKIRAMLSNYPNNPLSKKWTFVLDTSMSAESECGFFSNKGNTPHYSPFNNIELVRYSQTFKERDYCFRRRYIDFIGEISPSLHPKKISATQTINSHKPVDKWLTGNANFRAYLGCYWDEMEYIHHDVWGERGNISDIGEDVIDGRASRDDIHYLFRVLTIAKLMQGKAGD